jgi:hypothetical protein
MAKTIDLNMEELMPRYVTINVNLKHEKRFWLRMKIAAVFVLVAAKIMGCPIEISTNIIEED